MKVNTKGLTPGYCLWKLSEKMLFLVADSFFKPFLLFEDNANPPTPPQIMQYILKNALKLNGLISLVSWGLLVLYQLQKVIVCYILSMKTEFFEFTKPFLAHPGRSVLCILGAGAVACYLLVHLCACLSLSLPANISKAQVHTPLACKFRRMWTSWEIPMPVFSIFKPCIKAT